MTEAQLSPTTRRMGPAGSANWHAMLDGAEDILREQGYAALTSRAVAERIGVKQRLVYYYFRTMDDLFLAAFRRRAEQGLEVQAQVLQATMSANARSISASSSLRPAIGIAFAVRKMKRSTGMLKIL